MRLILASSSPRREFLLRSVGIEMKIEKPDVDETPLDGENPRDHVWRLAKAKARAVGQVDGLPIVAADTVVTIDGEILGKPRDDADARAMLTKLSGRVHEVLTGFAVRYGNHEIVDVVATQICFRSLAPDEIARYVATHEPMDKSGSYAIQGGGSYLIDWVDGSYSNVIGLPLTQVLAALNEVTRDRD